MTSAANPIPSKLVYKTTFNVEYAKLVDIVNRFDQRLLTMKSAG